MELRPYQQAAIGAVSTGWSEWRRQLIVLPTGAGKTVIFSSIAAEEPGRSLIISHREELVDQAIEKLHRARGVIAQKEKANHRASLAAKTVVASVQTLGARLSKWPADHFSLVVVDEAHHALASTWRRVIDHFCGGGARLLGVTATPDRGDKKALAEVFDNVAYEVTLLEMVRDGYLCPIRVQHLPVEVDMTKARTRAGDIAVEDASAAVGSVIEAIADAAVGHAWDRKLIVFLPLCAESENFTAMLNVRGIEARHIAGDSKDRAETLAWFAEPGPKALCNASLLLEGFDQPDVDAVLMLRPTKVRSLYCLDTQTEILTADGWKKDVVIGEEVAAFDPATGTVRFTPAKSVVRRRLYEGEEWVSMNGASCDIKVTDNHRMLYDHRKKTGWKFKTARDLALLRDTSYLPVAGEWEGSVGVPLSDDELRFIGWVMTDGTINQANGQITITQAEHQPWIEEIDKCIRGAGLKHTRSVYERRSAFTSNSECVRWTISKGTPRGRDKHLRGWGHLLPFLSKDFSIALYSCSPVQFDVLIEAIHLGDGCKQAGQSWTRRSFHIVTGNRTFAERLQIAGLLHGYRSNISTHHRKTASVLHYVRLKKQPWIRIGGTGVDRPAWKIEGSSSRGWCWCVENDIGTIVTRRNGKVAIVGNCQAIGRGTRIAPGKDHLLILDPLWLTGRHDLVRPAALVSKSKEEADAATQAMLALGGMDLLEGMAAGRRSLEEQLKEELETLARKPPKGQIDALAWSLAIRDTDLEGWEPTMKWHKQPASPAQIAVLQKAGFWSESITCKGQASLILDKLSLRRNMRLATPKQLLLLIKLGHPNPELETFEGASEWIDKALGGRRAA